MSNLPIRVALVDDEPRTLRAFQWEFGDDFQIKTFLGGTELLRALDAGEQIDVLISDQRMPGMAGHEVLKTVSEKYSPVRRLVMTAYADVVPLQSCVNEAGIDGYLEKPWDPAEVRTFVHRAYARHLAERASAEHRLAAARERWAVFQKERQDAVAQICELLSFGQNVKSTFFQVLELATTERPFDWDDVLLLDSTQDKTLVLDFLSVLESLMLLRTELPSSERRVLFYWWLLLEACPAGQGSSFFRHHQNHDGIALSFDAGAPFGDSILDPCGDRDPHTIRRNALLLLIIHELNQLGGGLYLVPHKNHFMGDLLIGPTVGGLS